MIERKFRGAMSAVYQTGRTAWKSCMQYLPRFTSFRGIYTEAYVTEKLAELNAAAKLKDDHQRSAVHELLRVEMTASADTAIETWKYLKRYVINAYPADIRDIQLMACGWANYEDATRHKWDSIVTMLENGLTFMTENQAALEENENMPATFTATYTDRMNDFMTGYDDFLQAEEEARVETEKKITATNNAYETLIQMMQDGQTIFVNEEAIRDQFVYDKVYSLVSAPGPAGLKGEVTYIINGQPVIGLSAEIEELDLVVTTDADGNYNFGNIPSGNYTVKYTLNGEVKDEETVVIPVGTTVRKDVEIGSN